MFYTVGEMAKKLNIAASTLRYYDKEGLMPFVERSGGGVASVCLKILILNGFPLLSV